MKIRNGFVSNSSSSSFCIYGTHLEDDFADVLKKIKKTDLKTYENGIDRILKDRKFNWTAEHYAKEVKLLKKIDVTNEQEEEQINDFLHTDDICELLTAWFGDNYEVFTPYEGDSGIYIGRSWSRIKDKETGAEFKASIKNDLKNVLGSDAKCETHEEAWRDG
jgi:hypothetical protein